MNGQESYTALAFFSRRHIRIPVLEKRTGIWDVPNTDFAIKSESTFYKVEFKMNHERQYFDMVDLY